jgi:LuxR family maltose regulon positive regulatory protein
VLPHLSVSRCAAVSGEPRAAWLLEEIEERGLFVSALDSEVYTLRLHDLFRDFLEERLKRDLPDEVPLLLRRAAETETDVVARVGYLLRAGAGNEAVAHVAQAALPMIRLGAADQLTSLIEQFPPALRDLSPDLSFALGLCEWNRMKWLTIVKSMRAAAVGYENSGRWQAAMKARALGSVVLFLVGVPAEARSFWDKAQRQPMDPDTELLAELRALAESTIEGPFQQTPRHLDRVVELLSTWPEIRGWLNFHTLYTCVGRWGMRAPLERLISVLEGFESESDRLLRPLVLGAWARLWRADFPAARKLADEAEAEARWLGDVAGLRLPLQHLRAIECLLRGDAEGMRERLRRIADEAAGSTERRSAPVFMCLLGICAAAADDWPTARSALDAVLANERAADWAYSRACSQALGAELLLHEGDAGGCATQMRVLGDRVADCDWWGLHPRVRVTWARAELRLGSAERAWQAIGPALQMALESEETLGLLMCGPTALAELAEGLGARPAAPLQLALLKACAVQARMLRDGSCGQAASASLAGDVELSERESEVLRLVAEGQSNKLIARGLGLSPHTIKRHVARILDKTEQSSRSQAAAWFNARRTRSVAGAAADRAPA